MILSHFTKDRRLRQALALWAVLAVAVSVKTVLCAERSVYPVFASGSRHWWADMPLYADYSATEGIDGYRYSPTFAVAFTPFCLLPDRLGAIAWNLLSIAMLVWGLHVLVRDVLPGGDCPNFLMLALAGSAVGIWSGQSNAILPALIAFGLAAIVRQRWWAACWLLALPVFIKLWPMALVLLLMVCWPRQLTWRFAVVCVALALVPFLTRPPDVVAWQYQEWYVSLTGPLQGRWPGYRDAWTIWEQVCPMFNCHADWEQSASRHVYMALQLATALGVLGWCLWQRRRRGLSQFSRRDGHGHINRLPGRENGTVPLAPGHLLTLILSMWVCWQLLFGPGTEQLTYGIIAPSASWAVLTSFAEKRARWLTVTAWAALSFLPSGDIEQAVLHVFPAGMVLLPLSVALFLAWLVWHERKAAGTSAGFL